MLDYRQAEGRMTDIFISYKREERVHAERIANALRGRGLAVWWDADMLPGDEYRGRTRQILQTCKAAIVVWSKAAAASGWVLDEAQLAKDRGVLVPVIVEQGAPIPIGFGQLHTHTLVEWSGDSNDALFRPVLAAVERLVGLGASSESGTDAEADAEVRLWRGVQDSRIKADFEAYLAHYPTGVFSNLARERLERLTSHPIGPDVRKFFSGASAQSGRAPLKVWDLAFVAAVALIAPFLLWPIVNAVIGAVGESGVFWASDYANLFNLGRPANIFFVVPGLVAAVWLYDRVEAWIERRPFQHARRVLRLAVGAVLALLVLLGLRHAGEDVGVAAHLALWTACAWLAGLVARRISPRLQRLFARD
jgi:hypothetical protein